jgi:hypothetical protein
MTLNVALEFLESYNNHLILVMRIMQHYLIEQIVFNVQENFLSIL